MRTTGASRLAPDRDRIPRPTKDPMGSRETPPIRGLERQMQRPHADGT